MEKVFDIIVENFKVFLASVVIVSPIIYSFLNRLYRFKLVSLRDELEALRNELETSRNIKKKADSAENKVFEFNVNDSVEFYNIIADIYDADNSKEIWYTHKRIAEFIKRERLKRKQFLVLDIGGGTGTLLLDMFALDPLIQWHYIDPAKGMYSIFSERFENMPVQIKLLKNKFENVVGEFKTKYDVIVMSFFLSSIPYFPDFAKIKDLLKIDGKLIIADAEIDYSSKKPYKVKKGKEIYILRTNLINHVELESKIKKAGFNSIEAVPVRKKETQQIYSYVHVFEPERLQ